VLRQPHYSKEEFPRRGREIYQSQVRSPTVILKEISTTESLQLFKIVRLESLMAAALALKSQEKYIKIWLS
jgi:hypothetical protein